MINLDRQDGTPQLTLREREVLELVACGQSAKEVGIELGIAHRTVERHLENARNKMGAKNKTHTILKAFFRGELEFRSETNGPLEELAEPLMISR